jgi:hypothetical protein
MLRIVIQRADFAGKIPLDQPHLKENRLKPVLLVPTTYCCFVSVYPSE